MGKLRLWDVRRLTWVQKKLASGRAGIWILIYLGDFCYRIHLCACQATNCWSHISDGDRYWYRKCQFSDHTSIIDSADICPVWIWIRTNTCCTVGQSFAVGSSFHAEVSSVIVIQKFMIFDRRLGKSCLQCEAWCWLDQMTWLQLCFSLDNLVWRSQTWPRPVCAAKRKHWGWECPVIRYQSSDYYLSCADLSEFQTQLDYNY